LEQRQKKAQASPFGENYPAYPPRADCGHERTRSGSRSAFAVVGFSGHGEENDFVFAREKESAEEGKVNAGFYPGVVCAEEGVVMSDWGVFC
jgi:hypothetical protein